MQTAEQAKAEAERRIEARRKARQARAREAEILYPNDVCERWGISRPTLWRWEKAEPRKIPARDVEIAGKTGWYRSTIEAAEARV